jgi:acetyl esterase/lipase
MLASIALAFQATVSAPALPARADEGLTTVAFDYEVKPNLTYLERPGWRGRLDLYLPADRTARTPVLVWFHGGGFTRSSKEEELLYVLPYLHRRWVVVNVEYRLADLAPAPGAVADTLCAMRWVATNAAAHKIGIHNLVVSGISAGGTLALAAGTMPATSRLAADCGEAYAVPLPRPRVIVNWFGPSNVADLLDGAHLQPQVASWFAGVPDRLAVAREISPAAYIRSRVPPTLTIHGDRDDVVPFAQSAALHRLLDSLGSPNELTAIRGAGHGDFDPAQVSRAYAAVFRFVETHLER